MFAFKISCACAYAVSINVFTSCPITSSISCPNTFRFSSVSNFIVYSVYPEQYEKLIALVGNQDVCDVSRIIGNVSPILYNKSNNKNIMVINQYGNVLYYINEWEYLIDNNEQKMPSVELKSISDEIECLFTTETLEDIVLSFKRHY